jgi:hypothetical protein
LPAYDFLFNYYKESCQNAEAEGLMVSYTDLDFRFIRFHLIQAKEAIS